MRDPTVIHPLARRGEKSGKIVFIDQADGKDHSFTSVINDMTGSRLSYFDNNPPSIDDSLTWVRSVFADIRKKARVKLDVGDF
jgi:hypothetical protein